MKKALIFILIIGLLTFAGCGRDTAFDDGDGDEADSGSRTVVIKGEEFDVDATRLVLSRKNLTSSDVSPVRRMVNLTFLELKSNNITSVNWASRLTKLERLDLSLNEISDLTPLANLTELQRLDLRLNDISSLSGLENLTRLTDLDLGSNYISDVRLLMGLTNLRTLYLNDNPIPEDMYDVLRAALPDTNIYF